MRIRGPLYSTVDGTQIIMIIMIKYDLVTIRNQVLINHDNHENPWSIILYRGWNADYHDYYDKI
jgi:hypothetical protein